MIRRCIHAIAALALLIPALAFGDLLTQSSPRLLASSGGGGGSPGEWADVYITDVDDIGSALATDGQTVGIEVGSDTGLLSVQVTGGSGGAITIVNGGSFDGAENAVKMVPPSSGPGDQYSAWLRNLDIWNNATHSVAQMNFRVLVYYGPRYYDLAPKAKSWGFQSQTVLSMSGGDGNNRSGVFDNRDTAFSTYRYVYPTVTTVSIYCNPLEGGFIEECPEDNHFLAIGPSANHAVLAPQTGGEWVCFEHVVDVRQDRGNANGLVRLLVSTRDGVISDRYVEAPLTHDAGWDFDARYIYAFEGLGFYWNDVGTAHADNYVLYSHATFAANMANTDTLIGCDNIPGWLQ